MKSCSSKAYLLNNPRVSSSTSYAISGVLATVVHDAVMNPAEVFSSCHFCIVGELFSQGVDVEDGLKVGNLILI